MNTGYAIIMIALAASLISLIFRIRDAAGSDAARRFADLSFAISGFAIASAMVLLVSAFVTDTYTYTYVYNYSSKDLPLAYKIAGLWAGQQGTFLLWAFILYVIGAILSAKNAEPAPVVMAVITTTKLFLLVILALPDYSPFRYIWNSLPGQIAIGMSPEDGSGLNPLLQNPWMIVHPPVLFIGYAAATVPFAFAINALITNEYASWIRRSYRWVLITVVTLGIGIFLGGYWAYTVLGWGGYWGWDPVENSSLIPWLATIALMHGLIVQRRVGALVKTNIALALASFLLVFYSTFLTRSGILSKFSVHSFGDLGLTAHLVIFLIACAGASFGLFIWRRRSMTGEPLGDSLSGVNNLVCYGVASLVAYAAFILIGTSMPILSRMALPEAASVATSFYNNISVPAGALILGLIIAASFAAAPSLIGRNLTIAVSVFSISLGIALNVTHTANPFGYLFTMLGSFIAVQAFIGLIVSRASTVRAARIAHLGVGVLVIGFVTSNLHSTTAQKQFTLGVPETIGPVEITFTGMTGSEKSALGFTVKDGGSVRHIHTAYYIEQRMHSLYREPAVIYGLVRDLYVAPVEYRHDAGSGVRLHMEKGKTQVSDGVTCEFLGFNTKLMNMMTGNGTILAEIRLSKGGTTRDVTTGLIIEDGRAVKSVDADAPELGKKISLLSMNVSAREIVVLAASTGKKEAPPAVLVDISFKRLIWLVWLGTIAIALGGIVGLFYNKRS